GEHLLEACSTGAQLQVLEQLLERLNRTQLGELAATLPACRIAMESCPGSQYWGRRFVAQGHEVRIIPAQFVKPFVKSNKNDYNDAEAIAEAGTRDTMRCVPLKNSEQLDLQATHRVRQRFIIERTAAVNQMKLRRSARRVRCCSAR
ncbi:MAG: IS110 family transposase, partial [Acetobacteraceae bacterium]